MIAVYPLLALGMAAAMMPWLPLAAVVALAQSAEPKRENPPTKLPDPAPVSLGGNVVAFRRYFDCNLNRVDDKLGNALGCPE